LTFPSSSLGRNESVVVSVRLLESPFTNSSINISIFIPALTSTFSVNVSRVDLFGVRDFCSLRVVVSDRLPPTITCPDAISIIPANNTRVGFSNCSLIMSGANPVRGNITGSLCPGSALLADETGIARLTRNPPLASPFPFGRWNVTYTGYDSSGNVGSCVTAVEVLDVVNPSLTCPSSISLPENPNSVKTPVPLCFSSADNIGLAKMYFNSSLGANLFQTVYSASNLLRTLNAKVNNVSIVRDPVNNFVLSEVICIQLPVAVSSHFVIATVFDHGGNSVSCSFNVSVVPAQATAQLNSVLESLSITSGQPVNSSVLGAATSTMANLTRSAEQMTPSQVSRTAAVMSQLISASSTANVNTTNVFSVLDQVFNISFAAAKEAESSDGSASLIRASVAQFAQLFNASNTTVAMLLFLFFSFSLYIKIV
jgi:hypothetical protein